MLKEFFEFYHLVHLVGTDSLVYNGYQGRCIELKDVLYTNPPQFA